MNKFQSKKKNKTNYKNQGSPSVGLLNQYNINSGDMVSQPHRCRDHLEEVDDMMSIQIQFLNLVKYGGKSNLSLFLYLAVSFIIILIVIIVVLCRVEWSEFDRDFLLIRLTVIFLVLHPSVHLILLILYVVRVLVVDVSLPQSTPRDSSTPYVQRHPHR